MPRSVLVVIATSLWLSVTGNSRLHADEPPPAGRPWFVACLSSLDQLQNNVDAALQAADQPELAEILSERIKRWRDLEGIDRTRPAGIVRFWPAMPGASAEEVLFIPAGERAKFMKTVTFDVVGFTRRSDDHYVIARPGVPYHVLFRSDVGWMGDRVSTLQTCAGLHGEWTSELVRKHDIGLLWDLRQIPAEIRSRVSEDWKRALEPLLQKRDSEPDELFQVRRSWSEPLVAASALAIEQTRKIVLQINYEKERSAVVLNVRLVAEPRSEWEKLLQQWRPARSPWQDLVDAKDIRASGFVAGLPGANLQDDDAPSPHGSQLAWQVFGDTMPFRVAVLALRDGHFEAAPRSLATVKTAPHEYRRVRIPDVPNWVRTWIGGNTEAWSVREKKAVWLAFGAPEIARARLETALAPQEPAPMPAPPRSPVCLSAKIPLRECLDAVPWFDHMWMQQQLAGHEDLIDVTVTPAEDGLQIRATLPAGAIRILGGIVADDLAQEAEWLFRGPTE